MQEYEGVTRPWLRWYDNDGLWVPNKDETIAQERSRAEQELKQRQAAEQRAEQELRQRQKAEHENQRLRERLQELGIDFD